MEACKLTPAIPEYVPDSIPSHFARAAYTVLQPVGRQAGASLTVIAGLPSHKSWLHSRPGVHQNSIALLGLLRPPGQAAATSARQTVETASSAGRCNVRCFWRPWGLKLGLGLRLRRKLYMRPRRRLLCARVSLGARTA
jgi:hypothetical protein